MAYTQACKTYTQVYGLYTALNLENLRNLISFN